MWRDGSRAYVPCCSTIRTVGEAERAIRQRKRAADRAWRHYDRLKTGKSWEQQQKETEHWRRWAEFEPLVPQAIEALRRAGWPDPDRILKVGPFNVRRAAWALVTGTWTVPESSRGSERLTSHSSYFLLSDGRLARHSYADKAQSVVRVSYWREPTRCMTYDYQQMVDSLRALIRLPPR